jgi:hypothetical protein
MADTLNQLAYEGGRLLKLLGMVVSADGGPRGLLNSLGWDLPPGVEDIGLAAIDLTALSAKIDRLEEALSTGVSALELDGKFADVLVALEQAFVHLRAAVASLSATGDYIDKTQIKSELLPRLNSLLLASRLGSHSPLGLLVLQLFGVVTVTHFDADPSIYQVEHSRTNFDWDALGRLFIDPLGLIESRYGWGTPAFDGRGFVINLSALIETLGEPVRVRDLPRRIEEQLAGQFIPEAATDPAPQLIASLIRGDAASGLDVGISLFPLRPSSAGASDGGLAMHPFAYGTTDLKFPLSKQLTLEFESTAALDSGVVLQFRPGRPPKLNAGLVGNGGIVDGITGNALVRLTNAAATGSSHTLLALPGGGIVEAESISFGAGVEASGGAFTPSFVAQLQGGHAALKADGADSFLASIVPSGGLDVKFDLGMRWSGAQGFSFEGSVTAEIDLPLHVAIGPFRIDDVHVGLLPSGAGLALEVSVAGGVALGPVSAAFDRLGAIVNLAFHDGNLGPIDVGFGFKPPSGIGLSIDAGGVVTGGGFLFHDPVQPVYAGVMQLSLNDAISLTAFGLIATQLPDGSPGYSLLVFITAEDFQPIPLGMGFTLLGIGGMVAINRTFDQDVLRQGLKNDTLGTLLFPRDPVGNAPALIRSLAAAFPANRGSYLLGILAKIGWFTPTLVLLELALILEFGSRKRLLVLGRISSILPSPDNDLIRLVLDAIGVIDFDQSTTSIDAVLVDSRLARAYALTGAMALRANWGSGPGSTFVLAIGGLHPQFPPPADLPKLDRIAIALSSGSNPRMVCQAYFAITANTVQFGAAASLYAAAYGFSVEGDIGYDVLLQIAPLHFIADFNAKLQLKHGSTNLFSVSLDGELEGPRPLRVSGKASFEIFWCSFSIRFDATLIDGEPPLPPPSVDLGGLLTQALRAPTSWSVQTLFSHGVALKKLAPADTLVLDPLGLLVVKQQVAPLNTSRDIDLYGGAPVAGARRFQLAASLQGDVQSTSPISAPFAPAQFFAMSDDDKLAAPSFEIMDAGLVIGDGAVRFDEIVAAALEYDSIVVDTMPQPSTRPNRYALLTGLLIDQSRSGSAAKAPTRRIGPARYAQAGASPAATLKPITWTIQPLADGTPPALDPKLSTWSEYRATLAALNRSQASWQMVPAHELVTA